MRKFLLVVILMAVIGLSFWSTHIVNSSITVPHADNVDRAQDLKELEHKVLSFTIDGRSPKGAKQWHLEGNSAELIEDKIHLNDLNAVAYSDNATIYLNSDKGIYDKAAGMVELIGDVKVTSDKGFTITTEEASWSQMDKEIQTDTLIIIDRPGMSAQGIGGKANSDEKWARLEKDVVVKVDPNTTVNCDGPLEVSYNDNRGIFYNNVVVEDKDGKLFADKLIVDIDPETQQLAKVTAEGDVKVKKGNSYTISEKAVYTESTGHVQLLGKPRIIIDPQELDQLENFTSRKKE